MKTPEQNLYAFLRQPLSLVQGVGPAIAKKLVGRGIASLGDLLLHHPKTYIDDHEIIPIKALQEGLAARIQGHVASRRARGFGRNRQVQLQLVDEDGASIMLNFFHSGYMMTDARLTEGNTITVRGTPERWNNRLQMNHPEWSTLERFHPGWRPVYPGLAGLSSKKLESLLRHALLLVPKASTSPLDALFPDLPGMGAALRTLHAVDEEPELDSIRMASRRLKLEEFAVYLELMRDKKRTAESEAAVCGSEALAGKLTVSLPFALTEAQQQVLGEIGNDMASGVRMHRLLQGDVGAGKTVVAALAACRSMDTGLQVAMMAPTEVLAAQHYQSLTELFTPLGIEVALLTGSTKASERKALLASLANGGLKLVVGTHALIVEDVVFQRLGLAVVDEQHRFGVRQRWGLSEKGEGVHLLGMTATPIPRSLALALYGDMDLSVMRGLPPGRKPVETRVIRDEKLPQLADGMQRILDQGSDQGGGRIYWVVPRIDEDEDGVSVVSRVEALRKRFPKERVLGLHGRMKAAEKQEALDAFAKGECRILVSTTVVEVGVNVPEARLMVVEQAERYGLAQLHQLRGRVGRGQEQSFCMLLASKDASSPAMERLQKMTETHDGFELAELDLKLRGAGDVLGKQQSGEAGFRLLDPVWDAEMIQDWHARNVSAFIDDSMVAFWRPDALLAD